MVFSSVVGEMSFGDGMVELELLFVDQRRSLGAVEVEALKGSAQAAVGAWSPFALPPLKPPYVLCSFTPMAAITAVCIHLLHFKRIHCSRDGKDEIDENCSRHPTPPAPETHSEQRWWSEAA
ncbi:hypothetical protein EV1_043677 [Malus domestica]